LGALIGFWQARVKPVRRRRTRREEIHMELFLDAANLEEIRFWSERLSIDGVTTNPTLIAREGIRPAEVVPKIFEIIGQDWFMSRFWPRILRV
jgi:hypothetical protein